MKYGSLLGKNGKVGKYCMREGRARARRGRVLTGRVLRASLCRNAPMWRCLSAHRFSGHVHIRHRLIISFYSYIFFRLLESVIFDTAADDINSFQAAPLWLWSSYLSVFSSVAPLSVPPTTPSYWLNVKVQDFHFCHKCISVPNINYRFPWWLISIKKTKQSNPSAHIWLGN